jgi:hypothetical protein
MTTTERLLAMWEMGRTRLTRLLDQVSDEKLPRRMHSDSSSAAFLLRHMGEVDRLFARNIFGLDITVKARTLGPPPDTPSSPPSPEPSSEGRTP